MPIIAISRGSMSGGQALAECVAVALGVPCVGREVVVAGAAKIGVSAETLAGKLEASPGVWDRLSHERRLFMVAVQAALAEVVADGNVVYHGLGGHLLLRGVPAVLRVRLIAPTAMRMRAVMERQHLKPDAARAYIDKVDGDRVRWSKFLHGVDLREPGLYDLVLSLESMSIRSACNVVSATAGQPEFVVTDEVRARLADFRLACRVKLALAQQPASRSLDLDVRADRGRVIVACATPEVAPLAAAGARLERELIEVVERVEGVRSVTMHVVSSGLRA